MRCAFCEIPEIQERKVFENDLAWAFLTNIPIVPGHILICPKRCVAKVEELTKEEIEAVLTVLEKVKKALIKTFGAEGFNYAWNEEKIAGQSVPHFHLHVIPRKPEDEGVWQYEPREFLYRPGSREVTPEEELVVVAGLLRGSL